MDVGISPGRNDTRHYLKEALLENGYLSSMAVRRAIEVLRHENKAELYLANPDARSILDNWAAPQGWRRAARMFGCHRVACDKPNGIYFIPIFEGKDSAGHWLTVIIHKQGRFRNGYIMDSLGNATSNAPIFNKIRELFKSARSSFSWRNISCFPQVEVECGPRTIMHITRTIEELSKGNTLEACMEKASMLHENSTGYSALSIRESAADIIGRYESSMWTNPVRTGRVQETQEPGGVSKQTKRRKRRRRNKLMDVSEDKAFP